MPDRRSSPGLSVITDSPVFILTERQRTALHMAAQGFTEFNIALQLGLHPRTVQKHLAGARNVLKASSTTHAVAIAVAARLIEVDF